jgi:glycosyltransferase involved in cell wall biosynthesis
MSAPGPGASTISVLIPAYASQATIGRVLDAVFAQRRPPDEVVVVESSGDGTAELVRGRYPSVRLVAHPGRLYPGAARNRALAVATGEVIACLDADCEPDLDWTERIEAALRAGHDAVAGAVLNARGSSLVGWAYFLSEFAPWLPSAERDLEDAPTCNTAYRRSVLDRMGAFTEEPLLSADSLAHWRIRRGGTRLRFRPEMRVRHLYLGSARDLLSRRFVHGRSLSAARALFSPWSLPRRVAYAGAAVLLLPVFYLGRLFLRAFGHPEVPTALFVRALPMTAAALVMWSLGQAVGLLTPREMAA